TSVMAVRTAMAPNVPQMMARLRRCGGSPRAASAITIALSPASTRLMTMIAASAEKNSAEKSSMSPPEKVRTDFRWRAATGEMKKSDGDDYVLRRLESRHLQRGVARAARKKRSSGEVVNPGHAPIQARSVVPGLTGKPALQARPLPHRRALENACTTR